jgi:hypothetical protein
MLEGSKCLAEIVSIAVYTVVTKGKGKSSERAAIVLRAIVDFWIKNTSNMI